MVKKKKEEVGNPPEGGNGVPPLPEAPVAKSEKEILLELYKTLKDLGINSISDLEVRISRL